MLSFLFRHPLFMALGIGLVALSIYLSYRKHNQLLTGHIADGEVIELIPHHSSKGGPTYSLRVAYTKADNTKNEFDTTFSSSPPMHQRGDKVRVVYYPDTAMSAPDILDFPDLFLFPWVLFCVGLFILLMCAGFAYGPSFIDSTYLPRLANPDPMKTLNLLK